MSDALQHGHKLWDSILDARVADGRGVTYAPNFDGWVARAKQPGASSGGGKTGHTKKRREECQEIYPAKTKELVTAWRQDLCAREKAHDAKQLAAIDAVIARCCAEAVAMRTDVVEKCEGDPMLAIVHGLPGAGKSQVIKWLRELFVTLGWTHGVEFICAAPMNAMASLIDGVTVHNLGSLGIDLLPGAQPGGKLDSSRTRANALYTKLQNARWLLIDEIENVSVELLVALDTQIGDSTRTGARSFASRADGSRRLFGGINLITFGDVWQIPPVRQTSITSNPFAKHKAKVQRILHLFWAHGERDTLTHRFLLDVSHRSKGDAFLTAFLGEARAGLLSWAMYNFIHGYETLVPGSWLPATGTDGTLTCKNPQCERLWRAEWLRLFTQGVPGAQLLDMECTVCKEERRRRNRLLQPGSDAHLQPNFAGAPYIHPFHAPKTLVFLLRAVHYAQAKGQQLLWCVAHDEPLSRDDETRSADSLRNARQRWVTYTESKTAGLVGFLPISADLPVRFTDTIDASHGACKHATGAIVGWCLDEPTGDAAEVVLSKLPRCIFVRIKDATWTLDESLGVGVLPVKPRAAYWARAPGASVKRTGFPIVPNLGGTAHSYTGSTLSSAIVDLLDPSRTPRFDDVPRSYVAISRVCDAGNLLLAQQLAPCLFRMGAQPGPTLLLQWLEGAMSREELQAVWEASDTDAARQKQVRRLGELRLPCALCRKERKVEEYSNAPPAGTCGRWYPALTLVQAGAWRKCGACCAKGSVEVTPPVKAMDTLACYKCGKTKPRTEYDKGTVDALNESGALWRAVCVVCDPSTLRTQITGDGATFSCIGC